MANIYYPQGSRILQRNTVSSSFTEEVIGVLPNVVFFFNSGSQLDWISSSVFSLTSSWAENVISSSHAISASYAPGSPAISASYATTASYALNGGSGGSLSTGSSYPFTSSWAVSASYVISASNYTIPSFIKFDASEFIPRTTNGCGITSAETTINAVNRDLLTFDPGLSEYAQAWFNWPAGWNTVNLALCWYATAASGTAVFFASVKIFNHGDSIDSVISGSDTDGSNTLLGIAAGTSGANKENFSYVAGSSFNPQGTKTAGNRAVLQIYRMGSHGSDSLSTDALVDGVYLFKVT